MYKSYSHQSKHVFLLNLFVIKGCSIKCMTKTCFFANLSDIFFPYPFFFLKNYLVSPARICEKTEFLSSYLGFVNIRQYLELEKWLFYSNETDMTRSLIKKLASFSHLACFCLQLLADISSSNMTQILL